MCMLLLTAADALQVQDAWLWALGVHVFSWYMQIHPGHAVLEGRKPALLDSLVQVRPLLRCAVDEHVSAGAACEHGSAGPACVADAMPEEGWRRWGHHGCCMTSHMYLVSCIMWHFACMEHLQAQLHSLVPLFQQGSYAGQGALPPLYGMYQAAAARTDSASAAAAPSFRLWCARRFVKGTTPALSIS